MESMYARYTYPVPLISSSCVHVYECDMPTKNSTDILETLTHVHTIHFYYSGKEKKSIRVPKGCTRFEVHTTSDAVLPCPPIDVENSSVQTLVFDQCVLSQQSLPPIKTLLLRSCSDLQHPMRAETLYLESCTDPPLAQLTADKHLFLYQITFTAPDTLIETAANVRMVQCKGHVTLQCGPILALREVFADPVIRSPIESLAILFCDSIFPSASRVLERFIQARTIYYASRTQQNIICGQGGKNLQALVLQGFGVARCLMNCPSLQTLVLYDAAIEHMRVDPAQIYIYGTNANVPDKVPRKAFVSTAQWAQIDPGLNVLLEEW